MAPRWKGKKAKAKALAEPMSNIISQLKSTLIESNSHGTLSGSSILLAVETKNIELLSRASFGQPIITSQKDRQWFQLSLEEAFYLCYDLKCLKIMGENDSPKTENELWNYMIFKGDKFPIIYKAYAYFRMRNWVVRSGSQYGVDFVVYRHHPELVHSEYAVLVQSEGDGEVNGRLSVWSDYQCTLRLCGGVAKTLLVLYINKNGAGFVFPRCLDSYGVEARTISRWFPEQNRENKAEKDGAKKVREKEFNRLSSSLRAKKEHASLLEDFKEFDRTRLDLEDGGSHDQALLKEHASISRSTGQMDSVISQAQETIKTLVFQRSTFGGINLKLSNVSSRLPSVNQILSAIKKKKSMDTIILSLVASVCTFLILIYWLTK